jgi:branched-chain amino acid transport system substrate-binding protein
MITFRCKIPLLAGVSVLTALGTGCPQPAQNPIRVGVVLALTGPNSAAGENQKDAAILAAEQINAAGGVLGRPLELDLRDDQSTVAVAEMVARDLVSPDGGTPDAGVQVMLGSNPGGNSLRIATAVTGPARVVQISGASSAPELSNLGTGYFFRTVPSDKYGMALQARRATEAGYTKVAQIYSPTLATTAAVFAKAFKAQGGTITKGPIGPNGPNPDGYLITENQTSYKSVLAETFAGNPEAIQISCRLLDTAQIVRDYLDNYVGNGTYWYFSLQHAQSDFVTAVGRDRFTFLHEGARPTILPGNDRFPFFQSSFQAKYGRLPEGYGQANTYDAVMVLALAISAAGAVEGPAVHDWMQKVSRDGTKYGPSEIADALVAAKRNDIDYAGASGEVDFDNNGDVITGYDVWRVTPDGTIKNEQTDIVAPEPPP